MSKPTKRRLEISKTAFKVAPKMQSVTQGTKAVDGEAQNSEPTVISSLTDNINSDIENEKNKYFYAGQKLFDGAGKGKELSQGECNGANSREHFVRYDYWIRPGRGQHCDHQK